MYNKVPGDGREFCVCGHNAVKIRAEEGRSVSEVNIGPFVGELPFGKGTERFTTKDSSGTTSQAANIMEVRFCGVTKSSAICNL
jgi:predicted ABC-class ATPase